MTLRKHGLHLTTTHSTGQDAKDLGSDHKQSSYLTVFSAPTLTPDLAVPPVTIISLLSLYPGTPREPGIDCMHLVKFSQEPWE